MLRLQLLLLGAATFVGAIQWRGARATHGATLVTSVMPAPTSPAVLKRDAWSPQYCGFIGGIQSLGVTCSTHSSCVWNTDYFVVGCCATASKACVFYTSCVDINSPTTVEDDPLVYTCRGSKTCYENNYPSNYRQWGCGWNATSILFTYPGQADGDTIQQAFIGTKELEAVNTVTVTSIAMTMITTSDPNAPTAASQSSNSGVSTGTIVGATMGSAAILAIGAVIVTILIFRHRKKHLGQQPLPGTMDTPNMGTGTDIGASPVSGMHSGHPSTVGTGTYYPKDPYSAVSSPSQGYLQTPSSVTGHGHGDMVYHQSYQPSQMSPQIPPLSPEPREMDAGGP